MPDDRPARPHPAFYALEPGGWRDYWTLLHPPYTAWHLSFVCIGWAAGPAAHWDRLWAALAAFGLAVGIGAHALDELSGRPLRTRIPSTVLGALAAASVGAAVAIGVAGAARSSWWLLAFVGFGAFVVAAYNLEWFGGRFHSDAWFAGAWGGFPALTSGWVNGERMTAPVVLAALACAAIAVAQRRLSTPVRALRRATVSVSGEIVRVDGTRAPVDERTLRAAPEGALVALSIAMPLLAAAVVAARHG